MMDTLMEILRALLYWGSAGLAGAFIAVLIANLLGL